MQQVVIETEFIRLEALLKFASLVETGGIAKELIQEGCIMVNDSVEQRRGRKIYPGDIVSISVLTESEDNDEQAEEIRVLIKSRE